MARFAVAQCFASLGSVHRGSKVGRLIIGGTDGTRRSYERIRMRQLRTEVETRRAQAQPYGPAGIIDPDVGYAIVPTSGWDHVDDAIATAHRVVDRQGAETTPQNNKGQLTSGFLPPSAIDSGSPLLQLALSDAVLRPVISYLGSVPVLDQVDVWHSVEAGLVGSPLTESQLYHCDWEATTKVRVLVYASSVADKDGPLTVIDAAESARVRRSTRYRYLPHRTDRLRPRRFSLRVPDDVVYAVADPARARAVVGPAGTAAFVDTSRCLHYGSRVQGHGERLAVVFQFLPVTAFTVPPGASVAIEAPFAHARTNEMTDVQKMVLAS
jgi:hypothetical protein